MRKKTWISTAGLAAVLLLIGAAGLVYLKRINIDPRIYLWLTSDTGKTVARIIGWSVDFKLPPIDIPESEMTEEELEVKRELESAVERDQPRHRLTLDTGETLSGRIVANTPNTITFMERYGESGEMAFQVRLGRIRDIAENTNDIPRITYRDVRLKIEFPEFEFHRMPPFTVITDENFFRAQKSVRSLQRVFREFNETFSPIITRPERGDGIQLLFFMEEKQYHKYADKYAPQLENSSGFYSPKLDRLIVFNQVTSDQLNEAKRALKRQERLYKRNASTPQEIERVKIWRSDAARSIARHAELQTEITVRHEGAHQLFFTFGVHSSHHSENSWLIEGLASYCEGPRLGDRLPENIAVIKDHLRENTVIPMSTLLNSRSPSGLFAFGKEERVHLAYAQSWATVHFLMQPKFRDGFFDYIHFVRDPANIDTLSIQPRERVLADHLGFDPDQLERLWMLYLQRL